MEYPEILPNWLILGVGAISAALAVLVMLSF